jgi:hypothetical protein
MQTNGFQKEKGSVKNAGPKTGKWDTDDGKYGSEEEEVVGEDGSKVEPLVAASWRHD